MSSNIAERNRFERLSRTAVLGLAACTLLAACSQEPGAMPGDSSDDAGGNVGQADAGVGDSDDGGHDNDGGHTGGGGGGGSGGGHRDGLAVLTNRYDNLRTGANVHEDKLTPAVVRSGKFGLIFSRPVDGQIYAQPLYMSNLSIAGGTHNVVFVATEHNIVYAFDADDPKASKPLWSTSVGTSAPLIPKQNIRCADMFPEQGITSTPVIDEKTGTLYVTGVTFGKGVYAQKLFALDIHTGAQRSGGEVEISASGFDPHWQLSRSGLLLEDGTIYIAFGSNCDQGPYHGWVFAYDAETFARKGAYNNTVGGTQGGIWMSGVGLPSDGSSVYFAGGNGSFDASNKGAQLGSSFGKLQLTGKGLKVDDYYTPDNAQELNDKDADLTTVIVLPDSDLLVGGSKSGQLFVMNRTNMGGFRRNGDTTQRIDVGGHVHGGPVYWMSPSGPRVYVWSEESPLQAFAVQRSRLGPKPVAKSAVIAGGHPGGMITISSNGSDNGIVWGAFAPVGDGFHTLVKGILVAYDANDLKVLWRSDANSRDTVGNFAKFNPPVVANGRVYLGSQSNALRVYGRL